MTKHFEDDELLKSLGKAAGKNKAPKLDELIIHTAVSSEPKYGPRRLRTPGLILNLVGGAAILAGVFAIANPFIQDSITPLSAKVDSTSRPDYLQTVAPSLAAIRMGNETFTEEDFLARNEKSLSKFGQDTVGNYISNRPDEYIDEIWAGQGGYIDGQWPTQDGYIKGGLWVFVVTDAAYMSNGEGLFRLLSAEMLDKHASEIASRSDEDGIRLLVQGENRKLYPLVIRVNNKPGSLYKQVLENLEGDTFTKVPNF
jgi:hypothetical protein